VTLSGSDKKRSQLAVRGLMARTESGPGHHVST
jgi:hypothetical protein